MGDLSLPVHTGLTAWLPPPGNQQAPSLVGSTPEPEPWGSERLSARARGKQHTAGSELILRPQGSCSPLPLPSASPLLPQKGSICVCGMIHPPEPRLFLLAPPHAQICSGGVCGSKPAGSLQGRSAAWQPVINFPVLINSRISPSHYEAVGGAAQAAGLPGSEERLQEGPALLIASPGLRWAH